MNSAARVANQLVKAAYEIHALRLWETFEPDDAIAFEIPGREGVFAACICGQEGEEFGTTLFRTGLPGLARAFSLHDGIDDVDQMSLLVAPLYDVPPAMRGLLEAARWRGRRETPAPHMFVKRPGKHARSPRPGEMRTMLYVVSAILAAHKAGDLEPRWYAAEEGVQLLRLDGPPRAPRYTVDWIVCDEPQLESDAGDDFTLDPGDYEIHAGCWLAGIVPLDAGIRGDDRTVNALLVLDSDSEIVTHTDTFLGNDRDHAADSLLAHFEETGSIPARIVFQDRALRGLVRSTLAEQGVSCDYEPRQPKFEQIAANLAASMTRAHDFAVDPDDGPDAEVAAHLDELYAAIMKALEQRAPRRDRLFARYFGSAARGRELIDSAPDPGDIMLVLLNWGFFFYRARTGSKTVLERTLERKDLSAGAREIGERLRAATPSLHRVESTDPPLVELLDLATGKSVLVLDRALSRDTSIGTIIPAAVYEAGSHRAILPVGPALGPFRGGSVFERLESEGIELTPESLAAHSHFGGRLAELALEMPAMPQIRNTEGHEILFHTASFVADDPAAAANALRALPDIEEEPENGRYVWVVDKTLRGSIEPVDDHLILEVNSAERFESGRAMLESCPGVRFVGVRTKGLGPAPSDRETAPDDLPGIEEHDERARFGQADVPPEVQAAIHDHMTELQLKWLDTRIPAFDLKTPRELCATQHGRRRIRYEILSLPTPHPSLAGEPMKRIRARMLDELGLESDPA